MKERGQWMLAVLRGLGTASTEDVTVFLLLIAGTLLGGRRGLGKALLTYVLLHRADQYGHLYASKMDQNALVIRDGMLRFAEANKPAPIWTPQGQEQPLEHE